MLLVLLFLALRLKTTATNGQSKEIPVETTQPEIQSNSPASLENRPVEEVPSPERSGFVLQVGAMTHEENAMALMESLKQNSFPAFVSQHGKDHFYRVVVGPYSDVDSVLKAKEQLKKAGIDAFLVPWNPSAR